MGSRSWATATTGAASEYPALGEDPGQLLPAVHQVISLEKCWLLGRHHGMVEPAYFASYPNEFVFHFNRRRSRSRGAVVLRVLELAVSHVPVRFGDVVASRQSRTIQPISMRRHGHPPSLARPPANRPRRNASRDNNSAWMETPDLTNNLCPLNER